MTENHDYYRRVDRRTQERWFVRLCSYCSANQVLSQTIRDCGSHDHASRSFPKPVSGGKSKDGHYLCGACMTISTRIDMLKEIEKKIKNARYRMKKLNEQLQAAVDSLK